MSRAYDIVTFDCYGTLVDWDAGIGGAIARVGRDAGADPDPERIMDAYHRVEPAVQAEHFRPYRQVLQEVTRRVGGQLGWAVTELQAASVPESIGSWPVFEDTREALSRLQAAGYRLGILSNVDRDLFEKTRETLGVDFDLIVTAQDVRSYKPAHGHFLEARGLIGEARWLHAAQSWFHDVVPAKALGLKAAWINRKREKPGEEATADRELPDLAGLADWLA